MSQTKKTTSPKTDDVLRRMLSTPPTQHAQNPAPVKKAKKKPAK